MPAALEPRTLHSPVHLHSHYRLLSYPIKRFIHLVSGSLSLDSHFSFAVVLIDGNMKSDSRANSPVARENLEGKVSFALVTKL